MPCLLQAKMSNLPESPVSMQSTDQLARGDWEGMGKMLLDEGLVLTALELHAELLESGTNVACLRDYFSNPGNFEHAIPHPLSAIKTDLSTQVSVPVAACVVPACSSLECRCHLSENVYTFFIQLERQVSPLLTHWISIQMTEEMKITKLQVMRWCRFCITARLGGWNCDQKWQDTFMFAFFFEG